MGMAIFRQNRQNQARLGALMAAPNGFKVRRVAMI
jgi:hypothetical protein